MKITINIDKTLKEDTGAFELKEMRPEISKVITHLQNIDFKLLGIKDEKKYQLDFDKIVSIYASNKKVYTSMDDKSEFRISYNLTVVLEKLGVNFLRISNSEIVNADKISHFEITFGGKIKIYFKNGSFTYSSRGYLKEIKEYFGL